MEQLFEVLVFGGKALIIVVSVVILMLVSATLALKAKPAREQLEVESWNNKVDKFANALKSFVLSPKELKRQLKDLKKKEKLKAKRGDDEKRRIFVLDFEGDIKASPVDHFSNEMTAVISAAKSGRDEVLVVIKSQGGMVHTYGLAAAEMLRAKKHGLKLTACVDKVAASGGYLMACTADQILAAPFAIVGSIGVLAQVPNFHRLLKKHDVDFEEITAGEYKRTMSIFGEITEKGRQKFTDQIETTHDLFKDFVKSHRPQLDLAKVATGEYWYGNNALNLGLVDKIKTSQEYLLEQKDSADIYKVTLHERKKLADKINEAFSQATAAIFDRGLQKSIEQEWPRA